MGRKRRHGKKSRGGGGALTRLRGGFRSTVHSATGTGGGQAKPATPLRRTVTNLITIALLVAAAVLLLRRFGVLH